MMVKNTLVSYLVGPVKAIRESLLDCLYLDHEYLTLSPVPSSSIHVGFVILLRQAERRLPLLVLHFVINHVR